MSTSGSNGFRESIWEIRDYEIIAHYPEGDWCLTALEVESIRFEPGMDDGVPVCDAFLRAKNQPRSDMIGRFQQGEDQTCVELALFAARNRIQMIGQPLSAITKAPVKPGAIVTTTAVPRQRTNLPKSPDSSFETQVDPNQPYGFNQEIDPNQPHGFNQETSPNQPHSLNQETDPNQLYGFNKETDPNQPYSSNQETDPNQPHGFNPNQSYGPGGGFDPQQGFNPNNPTDFRNPEWWRWNYNRANPSFRRNIVLTVLASVFLMSLLGALLFGGLRFGSFYSGPGLIFLLIVLSNRKKGKRRR